mmetsp:Transcript_77018/g.217869  ORF Transcript_77018/g.217869 Transcript_77018/m.217869 type:complete len:203 (-) Transcript_77018:33-641(-)
MDKGRLCPGGQVHRHPEALPGGRVLPCEGGQARCHGADAHAGWLPRVRGHRGLHSCLGRDQGPRRDGGADRGPGPGHEPSDQLLEHEGHAVDGRARLGQPGPLQGGRGRPGHVREVREVLRLCPRRSRGARVGPRVVSPGSRGEGPPRHRLGLPVEAPLRGDGTRAGQASRAHGRVLGARAEFGPRRRRDVPKADIFTRPRG